jgi:uncharacterized protein YndB with AHSA1/START domain
MKNGTKSERVSEREFVVTRTFNHPARHVFEAWTQADLFARWWVPKAFRESLRSCDLDARPGGGYRLVFQHEGSEPMAFFGTYLDVTPHARLAWTNEEGAGGGAVTTVTLEEQEGRTLLVMHDLHPSSEALDAAIASGSLDCLGETFDQLDELLFTPGAGA